MKFGNFKAGIDILAKYVEDDQYCIHAEHDQFWAGPVESAEIVSEEDKKKLEELGWFVNEDSWSCFT